MKPAPGEFRDRLSMLDEHGNRRFLIPAEVRGAFHNLKNKVHFVLLLIFLALPWLQIHQEQLVRIDIPGRKFQFFGLHLLSHDAPLIFFVLFAFAMGLALMTALFGRVWCGWACPQTVFIESVYRKIEIWCEGTYIQRRQLRSAPWDANKVRKVFSKWGLYLAVSLLISHSFLAYWTGGRELLAMMSGAPAQNQFYFILVLSMTGILLFNFGWFREQFCLIVCPYGKFQSVLMDSQSLTVMYDEKRGEPRKGTVVEGAIRGACVSCQRCVQVCPTGIDIREGVQMECIGCTSCIDACDEIMTKIHQPKGLIRYKALSEKPIHWFRPRVVVYIFLLLSSVSGLAIALSHTTDLHIEFLRGKDVPYQVHTNSAGIDIVQNHFKIRLENQKNLDLEDLDIVTLVPGVELIGPIHHFTLQANETVEFPVFIEAARAQFKQGYLPFEIQVVNKEHENLAYKKNIQLIGPMN